MKVRLRFVVALLLVLPLLAHAIWDYVETRRLEVRIDAIGRNGEPLTANPYVQLSADAAQAERFYRAAAALASGDAGRIPPVIGYRIRQAERDRQWPADLVDYVRSFVGRHEEALSLVDRAAVLPFEGFAPGQNFTVRGVLGLLSNVVELRATIRALDGQADAAVESIYSDVRLARTLVFQRGFTAVLPFVFTRTQPSAAVRARLGQALADLDRDDRIARDFMAQRASLLDIRRRDVSVTPWIARPLVTRFLTRQLDVFAALIAAASKPAAERHAAIMAVGDWPTPFPTPDRGRLQLNMQLSAAERQVASIRCARRIVAGEVVDCQP